MAQGNTPARREVTSFSYACPVCGSADHGRADYKLGYDRRWQWLLNCFSCERDGYLAALAAEVGAPNGAVLKDDAPRYLEPYRVGAMRSGSREPAPLPSDEQIEAWAESLAGHRPALRYLRKERGLDTATLRRHGIGFARLGEFPGTWPEYEAFVLPVYDPETDELVNVRRRFWPETPIGRKGKPVKYAGLTGRIAVRIYPDLLPERGGLLLCEGEFDALVARRHGFPAVTVTGGKSTSFPEELAPLMQGRKVAVVYDVGAEDAARRRAEQLRDLGAEAWPVFLRRRGLTHGQDLTDWFVGDGRKKHTADELWQLIRAERKRATAAGGRRRGCR